jgi:hypothetical protein
MVKISENFNKNPKMSQKYPETICAWIIMQICRYKATVHINVQKVAKNEIEKELKSS